MYDYLEAMKQDIINYIRDEVNASDFTDREELEERLYDDLWIDSTITGNGGDNYTDNETSKEYINGNENLLKEALIEFCVDKEKIVDKFFAGDYAYFDTTIRCYMLSQAIGYSETVSGIKAGKHIESLRKSRNLLRLSAYKSIKTAKNQGLSRLFG